MTKVSFFLRKWTARRNNLTVNYLSSDAVLSELERDNFPSYNEGQKCMRHFRKMAPFWIVDLPIPFPCLPPPLPPKINVVFWTLKSFFYFRQHWFGGSGNVLHWILDPQVFFLLQTTLFRGVGECTPYFRGRPVTILTTCQSLPYPWLFGP